MSYFTVKQTEGTKPGTLVLRPEGPLTTSALPQFNAAVKSATEQRLVIDLGGVPYMDSAGLGALLVLHGALQKENRTVLFANPEKRVTVLMTLTKADTVLPMYPSVEAAEQS